LERNQYYIQSFTACQAQDNNFPAFSECFPESAAGRQDAEPPFRSPRRFFAGQGEASQEYFVYFKGL